MLRPELEPTTDLDPVLGTAEPGALHVMSMNLRNAAPGQFDPWEDRRGATAALLDTERPTVLGTQEGLYHQLRDVADDLPSGYDWIGTGRDGGSRGEFMAVFFDAVRLEPLEFDHFWLSDSPNVVGSTSWGNEVVRMATWIRFVDREADGPAGKEFVLLNTHLDHAVEAAQRNGALLLADRLRELTAAYPVIVTGDFNVPAENSEPYSILTEQTGLTDSWMTAEKRLTPAYATFHGYEAPVPEGERIDWILTSPTIRVESTAINTFRLPQDTQPQARRASEGSVPGEASNAAGFAASGGWVSDHWPVQALIRLP